MCTGHGNRKAKADVECFHEVSSGDVKAKLPIGVADFQIWGKSRIDFGKYEEHGMSYLHLARSQAPECIKYKNRCIQRNRSAEGLLKDLSDFLVEFQRLENLKYGPAQPEMPFIPGTERLRVYLD